MMTIQNTFALGKQIFGRSGIAALSSAPGNPIDVLPVPGNFVPGHLGAIIGGVLLFGAITLVATYFLWKVSHIRPLVNRGAGTKLHRKLSI